MITKMRKITYCKKLNASISIFFVFAVVLIISVILSVTEMARVNCQKLYLRLATNNALDSMASLYHRKLYDYYNIYGVEYREKEELEMEYLSYIMPYMKDERVNEYLKNWYIANIDESKINLNYDLLVNNDNMEQDALNYMKMAIIGRAIEFFGKTINVDTEDKLTDILESVKNIDEELKKSSLYEEVNKRYFDFSKNIKTLEKYAKNIENYVDDTNKIIKQLRSVAASSVSSAKSILSKIDKTVSNIEELINDFNEYKKHMNEFVEVINEKRRVYETDITSGKYEYSDDIKNFIESEFDYFINLVGPNSKMAEKVELGIKSSNNAISIMRQEQQKVSASILEIQSVEDELSDAKSMKGEDYDEELVKELNERRKEALSELKEVINDLRDTVKELEITDPELTVSSGNHTKNENLLEKLINLKSGVVLNYVLSNEEIEKIKEDTIPYNSFSLDSNIKNLSIDKVLMTEYILSKFHFYNKEKSNEMTASASEKLEVENIITGMSSDRENIKGVINKILLIRIPMNVLFVYKSATKRSIARQFAYKIFAGLSPLLAELMFIVILTAWGTAQSLVDVKKILKGYKVKFFHSTDTWDVDIDSILSMADGNGIETTDRDDEGIVLGYKDYLRIILLTMDEDIVNTRMAKIIDYNIRCEEETFDLNNIIYTFDVENSFICKHFFTRFTFVDAKNVTLYDEYMINVKGHRSYYEEYYKRE